MEKNDVRDILAMPLAGNPLAAVVLGAGNYPVASLPLQLLDKAPLVACLDGAADAFIERGGRPDVIVGDGDSLSAQNRQRFANIFYHNPDQETNDQTKAIHYLYDRGWREAVIVGGTGRREDHTLGNISLLIEYLRLGMRVSMATDHGIFLAASGTQRFACRTGQQVSIFGFGPDGFESENLRYPLRRLSNWWEGTLNEATADGFTVVTRNDYLIFFCY
jgi:thiamine pyrophosphokinase